MTYRWLRTDPKDPSRVIITQGDTEQVVAAPKPGARKHRRGAPRYVWTAAAAGAFSGALTSVVMNLWL